MEPMLNPLETGYPPCTVRKGGVATCYMLQLPKLEVLAARPDLFARSVSSKPIIRLQAPSVVTFTHQHQRKYERCLCV